MDLRPAALGWIIGGHLLRGKGLQVLDMGAVLPVSHLKLEEAHAAADDGEAVRGGMLWVSRRTTKHSA